jgi:hypothetical protein
MQQSSAGTRFFVALVTPPSVLTQYIQAFNIVCNAAITFTLMLLYELKYLFLKTYIKIFIKAALLVLFECLW